MKRFLSVAALVLIASLPALAQHSATITYKASADSTTTTPGTVSVYRAAGACPATGVPTGATLLSSAAPAAGPYVDSTVTVGTWSYYLTATIGGATSNPSNCSGGVVLPGSPSITIVVAQ